MILCCVRNACFSAVCVLMPFMLTCVMRCFIVDMLYVWAVMTVVVSV